MKAYRKIVTLVAAASIIFNMSAGGVSAAVSETRKNDKSDIRDRLPAGQTDSVGSIEDYYAGYQSITFRSARGGSSSLYLSGTTVGVNTDCGTGMRIMISNERGSIVSSGSGNSSFSFDTGSSINVNELYYIKFVITADTVQSVYKEIALTRKSDGSLCFVKSTCSDFNEERCSELWTDAQSLQECLQPQNDVECDSPEVIAKAQEITAGMRTDWDKAYAIYSYLTNEFSYDYIQIDDSYYIYQDDAASLLRRKVTICEGFGNTFTALCRAAGIPAAVSFGIGASASELVMADDYIGDEGCNHAWACVCLDGQWYHVDPTWDCQNSYSGDSYDTGNFDYSQASLDWYLLPLEYFSMSHKICDADTIHGIEETGSCGANATYEISRDGVITIHGSGTLQLPYGCNGFRYVVFADDCTVTKIGEDCFSDCDVLESVVLPDTVTEIDDGAFATCEDLEYIYLPDGLRTIGKGAFDYCDELAFVYVPDSVTSVGVWAFDDCPRAIISIPQGLNIHESDYYVSPYKIIERR